MRPEEALPSSFRDPAGYVFRREGVLYRRIEPPGLPHYDRLMGSGLYGELVGAGLLIPHEEVPGGPAAGSEGTKTIRPEEVPFVSYPYEWSFSMLRDAALATLEVERRALVRGMTLVDSSAFNVQFRHGRPVLIDTLSLRQAVEGAPWTAYGQFCRHFLAPLALMSLRDVRLGQLLRVHLDGVPLDLASRLLPRRSRLRPSLLLHLHAHAASQKKFEGRRALPAAARAKVGLRARLGLVDSLEAATRGLRWRPAGTEWADYEREASYTPQGLEDKRRAVETFVAEVRPRVVWDLGANVGAYSRAAATTASLVVAFDVDPACVERSYLLTREEGDGRVLPLLMDLANPSPPAGWENRERLSLLERGPADAVLALALVHHLAIGNNLPLERISSFLARAGRHLLIEFVPKSDPQVGRLLVTREDIFTSYSQGEFERAFERDFVIKRRLAISGSERVLYVMERRMKAP